MTTHRAMYYLTLLCLLLGGTMLFMLSSEESSVSQQTSPFGVSAPPAPVGGNFLRDKLSWVYQQQAAFYKSLTGAVKEAKSNSSAVWFLVGLSFLYGIFHAAGPGHGKVVISSYLLANEQSAKRGMIISFIAAFMQALVAVLLIGAAVFLFNFTSFAITEATHWFERISYALIAILGVYLLWQKGLRPFLQDRAAVNQIAIPDAHDGHSHHGHTHHHTDHSHHHNHGHDHDHACGFGGHAVDPGTMKQPLSLQSAWAAITSVGLRPCSGAIIVLVFASAQGLFWVGVASTFAMALGTAITVTSLAITTIAAKSLATRYLSVTRAGAAELVFKSVELLGASLVFLLGITLLAASLQV